MSIPTRAFPGANDADAKPDDLRVGSPGPSALRAPGSTPASTIEVNRYLVQKGGDTMLVLYWYQSHGRVIANGSPDAVRANEDVVRAYLGSAA